MFIGYFFSDAGTYHNQIYMLKVSEVRQLLFGYFKQVPKIRVCNDHDHVVAEALNGQITFPQLRGEDAKIINTIGDLAGIPEASSRTIIGYIHAMVRDIKKECINVHRLKKCDLSNIEFEHPVYKMERDLMALAARDGINLHKYRYSNVDEYLTRLTEGLPI